MEDSPRKQIDIQFFCWQNALTYFEQILAKYKGIEISDDAVYDIVHAAGKVSSEEIIYQKLIVALAQENLFDIASYKSEELVREQEAEIENRHSYALDVAENLIGSEIKQIYDLRHKIFGEHFNLATTAE